MGILSRFLPKKKPVEIKNTVPKEKDHIRKTFAVYCQSHHKPTGGKTLCPKCTALLATVMLKINRCPYGITKLICERCEIPCFGKKQTEEFREIMSQPPAKKFSLNTFLHRKKLTSATMPPICTSAITIQSMAQNTTIFRKQTGFR